MSKLKLRKGGWYLINFEDKGDPENSIINTPAKYIRSTAGGSQEKWFTSPLIPSGQFVVYIEDVVSKTEPLPSYKKLYEFWTKHKDKK